MIAPRFVSSSPTQHPISKKGIFPEAFRSCHYTIMEYRQLEIALLAKCIPTHKDNEMSSVDVQFEIFQIENNYLPRLFENLLLRITAYMAW